MAGLLGSRQGGAQGSNSSLYKGAPLPVINTPVTPHSRQVRPNLPSAQLCLGGAGPCVILLLSLGSRQRGWNERVSRRVEKIVRWKRCTSNNDLTEMLSG